MEKMPDWMLYLEEEDLNFVKLFVIHSGSLKEMAKHYGVTYPTVRLRLDKIIRKVETGSQKVDDAYIVLIKKMALEEKIDYETAKVLIAEYRKGLKTCQLQ